MFCPLCCFWRSALTEHGAETIAYIKHQAIQTQAQKRKKGVKQESITEKHNEKAKTSTRKEKQKQSRSGDYIKTPNKQKAKQAITAKQDKEKSKRDPRKAYKQTSKEGKGKAILFPPMPIYRIAIYIL